MKAPVILLTNDDGIESPGLAAAARAIAGLGRVIVAAPTRQQTAMGRSFSGSHDAFFNPVDFEADGASIEAFHCDCSPAQVVLHAFDTVFKDREPDLLVAGVNYGENLGLNVTLSGTVGAALQGAAMGIPSLAVSLQTTVDYHYRYGQVDWDAAEHFTRVFTRCMLEARMPDDVDVLKVDVPDDADSGTAWRVTRLARQSYYKLLGGELEPTTRIGDREVVIDIDHDSLEADSDVQAVAKDRIVSVTPLSLDITSRTSLESLDDVLRKGPGACPT